MRYAALVLVSLFLAGLPTNASAVDNLACADQARTGFCWGYEDGYQPFDNPVPVDTTINPTIALPGNRLVHLSYASDISLRDYASRTSLVMFDVRCRSGCVSSAADLYLWAQSWIYNSDREHRELRQLPARIFDWGDFQSPRNDAVILYTPEGNYAYAAAVITSGGIDRLIGFYFYHDNGLDAAAIQSEIIAQVDHINAQLGGG